MTELSALVGCRLQRIDGPRRELLALTFHRSDLHGVWLLAFGSAGAAWGWVPERPRGEPADSFVLLLRKHLTNARLEAVEVDASGGHLHLRRAQIAYGLHLTASPPNVLLIEGVDQPEGGRVLGARDPAAARGDAPTKRAPRGELASDVERLLEAGPPLLDALAGAARDARRQALGRALARRRKKLARRLVAIEADVGRVDEVQGLRERGSLLLSALRTIPAGATVATVMDWNADPPVPLEIAIDPTRTPRQEADALFRRARKLERGAEIALKRHETTAAELEALDALGREIASAPEDDLDELERRARRLDAAPPASAPSAGRAVERKPFRLFHGFGDRPILVGRSASDNDALTLRHARPWDHWLHARGVPGSHVVVPLGKSESCPPELLVDAAHLAAQFSDLRGQSPVEIQHLARRHVRKPRGAAPGSVTVQREKVLLLRIEPDRLERLLASEER